MANIYPVDFHELSAEHRYQMLFKALDKCIEWTLRLYVFVKLLFARSENECSC